jgi:phosphoglycerate kinase
LRNVSALHLLATLCDGLFFVGKLSFQIMNGLGMSVPSHFIERSAIAEVQQFIQVARARSIPIYYPTDMLCLSNDDNEKLGIFNSTDLSCGEYC